MPALMKISLEIRYYPILKILWMLTKMRLRYIFPQNFSVQNIFSATMIHQLTKDSFCTLQIRNFNTKFRFLSVCLYFKFQPTGRRASKETLDYFFVLEKNWKLLIVPFCSKNSLLQSCSYFGNFNDLGWLAAIFSN